MMQEKVTSWVDEYGDILYRYALGRVGDQATAQDLVQDAFIAAMEAQESFSGLSSEKTWLIGILKHKILDHFRKSYRGINKGLESAPDIDQYFDQKGHWKDPLPSWGRNPEKVLSDKEFVAVLKQCIDLLPQNQKIAFMLREIDGLESDDICKNLDVTATNLWVILHRARNNLRRCLQKNWFEK